MLGLTFVGMGSCRGGAFGGEPGSPDSTPLMVEGDWELFVATYTRSPIESFCGCRRREWTLSGSPTSGLRLSSTLGNHTSHAVYYLALTEVYDDLYGVPDLWRGSWPACELHRGRIRRGGLDPAPASKFRMGNRGKHRGEESCSIPPRGLSDDVPSSTRSSIYRGLGKLGSKNVTLEDLETYLLHWSNVTGVNQTLQELRSTYDAVFGGFALQGPLIPTGLGLLGGLYAMDWVRVILEDGRLLSATWCSILYWFFLRPSWQGLIDGAFSTFGTFVVVWGVCITREAWIPVVRRFT